eukprot:scaffold209171_cov21-Tisochrysis_lutea.AAC.1
MMKRCVCVCWDTLAPKSREPPPRQGYRHESFNGNLEVTGSTRLHDLAVGSIIVSICMPISIKLGYADRKSGYYTYYQSFLPH